MVRGCGNSTPASAAYSPAQANDGVKPANSISGGGGGGGMKRAQPRAPTFSQIQEAQGSGMGAADHHTHSRTATSGGQRSIAEEGSDADLQLYEEVVIDTVPRPIVVLPWAHVLDPSVIAQAIRVMETPQHVRDLLAGGVVLLSKAAEEIQAREQAAADALPRSPSRVPVVQLTEAAVLAEEDEDLPVAPQPLAGPQITLGSLFAVLARIYTLWNTPSAIPHLAFNPDIKRGSIIGGQAGLGISPLMPPASAPGQGTSSRGRADRSGKSPATAAAAATAAGDAADFLGSPVSPLPPAAPTPQTQGIKPDNKPAYVGEMIAFLKVWEGEMIADQEAYTRANNQALLAAALESLNTYEQLLSVAVTRGTFLRSMYAVQDQFLLHREREQVVQKIRERIKRRKTYQIGAFAAMKNPDRASLNSNSVSSFPPSSLMIDRAASASTNAAAAAAAATAAVSAGSPASDSAEAELMKRFATMADTLASHAVLQHCFSPLDFTWDIHAELSAYLQGTRLGLCRSFWQWVHENQAMPTYDDELEAHAKADPGLGPNGMLRPSTTMLLRRVFWLRGSPGIGKTNISALLCELFPNHILAVHFCKHDLESRKNPSSMIRSLAFQLAQKVPEYARELQQRIKKIASNALAAANGGAPPSSSTSASASAQQTPSLQQLLSQAHTAKTSLDTLSALDLFEQLLIAPLSSISRPATILKNEKMVLLIDAMDECEDQAGDSSSSSGRQKAQERNGTHDNQLLKILLQQVSLLPSWVGLCLTSRPSAQIVSALAKLRPTEISCDSKENLADLHKIIKAMLAAYMAPQDLEEACEILLAKSEGSLLYMRLVLDDRLGKLAYAATSSTAGSLSGSPMGVAPVPPAAAADSGMPTLVPTSRDGGSVTPPAAGSPPVKHRDSVGSVSAAAAAAASGGFMRPLTLAAVSAFPQGLHAFYNESFEALATYQRSFKQPLNPVLDIIQLILCSMEPLTPALLAQLMQPAGAIGGVIGGGCRKGEMSIIRAIHPIRALFPYRLMACSGSALRGKFRVVHKSVKDYLVDAHRLNTKKEALFYVNLRKGHRKLAERCWAALQVTTKAAAGLEGQQPGAVSTPATATTATPKPCILSEPFGASQAREDFLKNCGANVSGSTEMPPRLVPVVAPLLRLDEVLGVETSDAGTTILSAAALAAHAQGLSAAPKSTTGVSNAVRDSLLGYAVRFGPGHAIHSDDMLATAAFLCHPQYIHARAALGEAALLSIDYINAARQINSKTAGWVAEKRSLTALTTTTAAGKASSSKSSVCTWSWLNAVDACGGLINFQSFFQHELPHWIGNLELIYQYGLSFPDDTLVCRVSRAFMGFYMNWPARRFGLVNWDNKPQALGALMLTMRGHAGSVQSLAYSPDGLMLATASIDRSVRLWNAETGELRTELKGHAYHINAVAFSPDGRRLASAGSDNQVRLWDTTTHECTRVLSGNAGMRGGGNVGSGSGGDGDVRFACLSFSPDSRKLCCGVSDWCVWIWDLASFEVEVKLEGHKDNIHSTVYSPDGKLIASGSEDETIRIWAANSGKLVHEILAGHSKGVLALAFDADGMRMVSGGMDGLVRLWSCEDWSLLKEFTGHDRPVHGVAFHPDQVRLVSGSYDRKVRIWNSLNGRTLHTLHGHAEEVNGIACSPNGARIASCSADRTIMLWDSQLEVTVSSLAQASSEGLGHTGSIYSLSCSPDGERLVSCGEDKLVKIWNARTGALLVELKGHKEGVLAACFIGANGNRIVSGSTDSTIRFWDARTGLELTSSSTEGTASPGGVPTPSEIVPRVREKTGFVWALVPSPDGSQLVSGSTDASLRLWSTAIGELLRVIKGPKGMIYSVAWSPDGRRVAVGSETKVVRVYEVASGELKQELAHHTGDVHGVCYSPDGRWLASSSYDRSIALWDTASGKLVRTLCGHDGCVNSVAFSPSGEHLVSGGADQSVRVWNVASGEQVSLLRGHRDSVLFVRFNLDGSQILSAGKNRDQTLRSWTFAPAAAGGRRASGEGSSTVVALSSKHAPVSIPIGSQMAANFDFNTTKGSQVAGCIQLSCHT